MFIVGGFNAYPAEIENMLAAQSRRGAGRGRRRPRRRMGEVGVASSCPRRRRRLDADDFVAWCREHMANYKVPRHVEIVDALPLNATGKVDKRNLRDRYQQAIAAETAP